MGYNKYGNTRSGGFDSLRERGRFRELQLLERAGKISGLERQIKFDLIPSQYDENDKLVFRGISYVADFTYWENGQFIVEDVKGMKTDVYRLKAKLMYYFHHIKIRET